MSRYQILIDETSSRPVQELFNALADHQRLGQLLGTPIKRIKDGAGDANGVGSVRLISLGPLSVQETVRVYQPHQRIDYQVTKGGMPMKNHQGQMRFEATPKGSRLQWQIDFDMPPVLGSVVSQILKGVLIRGLRKLG